MPVTTSIYANNEKEIYNYITLELGYNTAIACGILANAEAESGFNPTVVGDKGAAYGLFQWNDRKSSLITYCSKNNFDYKSVRGQLAFLRYELDNSEKTARSYIEKIANTVSGAEKAARNFCRYYERPKDIEGESAKRGARAKDVYWKYYTSPSADTGNPVKNLGEDIVSIAREQIDKGYVSGGIGPSKFDSAGLLYYCYLLAGYEIEDKTLTSYHTMYSKTGRRVNLENTAAGDLLFYKKSTTSTDIDYVAIATGDGSRIYTTKETGKVVEDFNLGNPLDIFRILSDAETSPTDTAIEEYIALTSYDPYSAIIEANLSSVESLGYDYGYLIDITNGGEFRFYIPEFSESAGATWSPVEIRGRSVTIHSYDSTNSRNITINLDLYAGVGLYKATSGETGLDTVNRLHKDANFLKSLEYPDYRSAIVQPPPMVQLILGAAVNITGIVSNVTIEHMKPFDQYRRAMYLKVGFTVSQEEVNPPDFLDIRNKQTTLQSTDIIDSNSEYFNTRTSNLLNSNN